MKCVLGVQVEAGAPNKVSCHILGDFPLLNPLAGDASNDLVGTPGRRPSRNKLASNNEFACDTNGQDIHFGVNDVSQICRERSTDALLHIFHGNQECTRKSWQG